MYDFLLILSHSTVLKPPQVPAEFLVRTSYTHNELLPQASSVNFFTSTNIWQNFQSRELNTVSKHKPSEKSCDGLKVIFLDISCLKNSKLLILDRVKFEHQQHSWQVSSLFLPFFSRFLRIRLQWRLLFEEFSEPCIPINLKTRRKHRYSFNCTVWLESSN